MQFCLPQIPRILLWDLWWTKQDPEFWWYLVLIWYCYSNIVCYTFWILLWQWRSMIVHLSVLILGVPQVYITSVLKVFDFHVPLKRNFQVSFSVPIYFCWEFWICESNIYTCELVLTLLQLIYLQAKPFSCWTSDIQKLTDRGSFMANLLTLFFLVICLIHKLILWYTNHVSLCNIIQRMFMSLAH